MRGWPAFTPFIGYGYVGLEQVDVEGSRYADYSGVWSEGKGECTIYSQKKVLVGLENTKQQNRKQPDSPELFCVPNWLIEFGMQSQQLSGFLKIWALLTYICLINFQISYFCFAICESFLFPWNIVQSH